MIDVTAPFAGNMGAVKDVRNVPALRGSGRRAIRSRTRPMNESARGNKPVRLTRRSPPCGHAADPSDFTRRPPRSRRTSMAAMRRCSTGRGALHARQEQARRADPRHCRGDRGGMERGRAPVVDPTSMPMTRCSAAFPRSTAPRAPSPRPEPTLRATPARDFPICYRAEGAEALVAMLKAGKRQVIRSWSGREDALAKRAV